MNTSVFHHDQEYHQQLQSLQDKATRCLLQFSQLSFLETNSLSSSSLKFLHMSLDYLNNNLMMVLDDSFKNQMILLEKKAERAAEAERMRLLMLEIDPPLNLPWAAKLFNHLYRKYVA